MIQYEKINLEEKMNVKIIDIYYEDSSIEIEKHWHNSIEILVPIIGGAYIHDQGEVIYTLDKQVYIINSQNVHAVQLEKGHEIYKAYCIQINYDYLKSIKSDIDDYYFKQPEGKIAGDLLRLIYTMIELYDEHSALSYVGIQGAVNMLVYIMLTELLVLKNGHIETNLQLNKLNHLLRYMDMHISEELTLQSIADEFHVSPSYLSRYFKKNLGCTVKEYINRIRLKNAYHELVHTDATIIDICFNNGFPNPKAFQKVFKKCYGVTPGQYRKKVK